MRNKRIIALIMTLVMLFAMAATAMADAALDGGEVGGFEEADTPVSQDKSINIIKELTAYNADEAVIGAPTISYVYTITGGPDNISITDETTDHESGEAVTVTTTTGIVAGLKINGTAGATGTISWSASTETVDAAPTGAPNYKNLNLDFTDVVFGASGVYRYTITETAPDYAASGVTETDNDENPHVRYLDVYVKPADTVTEGGEAASDWDIYGYVCTLKSEDITPDGDTTTTGAVKTNGFVAGTKTRESVSYSADSYYTYNVKISKTVRNDAYAKATHAFPFTVIFTNEDVTQPVDIRSSKDGTVAGFTDPALGALSAGETKGIVTLKDSSWVKYIGIPTGTTTQVYETNDVTGTIYNVTTVFDGGTPLNENVVAGATPDEVVEQGTTKQAFQSTKTEFTPDADENDEISHVIAVDNNLQNISPTGLMFRYGPYVLTLLGGVLLLFLGIKFLRRSKDESENA
ncbi:MAG: hypothetical protein J5649_05875 [Lachnospiraceae bacterium]|nr:hypothetical protein [Lachnospiraceae bacterium]